MSKKIYIKVDKPIEVGDLVRCVEHDWSFKGGDIRKVSRMGMDSKVFFYAHGSGEPLWQEFWEPVHKLKVGDRVVSSYRPGEVFEVKNPNSYLHEDMVLLTVDDQLTAHVDPKNLTLYQPEKHDPKPVQRLTEPREFFLSFEPADRKKFLTDLRNMSRRQSMRQEVAEMIVELLDKDEKHDGLFLTSWEDDDKTVGVHSIDNKIYKATLSPSDTWDTLTGVYVALSKATGRKLPDWIYGGER